jgi:hypothetical protein
VVSGYEREQVQPLPHTQIAQLHPGLRVSVFLDI